MSFVERFTFERIHNTEEQIFSYQIADKYKTNERVFKSFKRADFPDDDPHHPHRYDGGNPLMGQVWWRKSRLCAY